MVERIKNKPLVVPPNPAADVRNEENREQKNEERRLRILKEMKNMKKKKDVDKKNGIDIVV